ncbi:putative leucine-rich repeat domain, L domain-containing protein [Medicago truncatula]|nr:putative leucine-rich repeat domain, L domain-containing protein [Medicago truncatula]
MAKNLNHIDLSYNSLSGEVSSSFHVEGLLNLVNLDLSYNSINGSISSVLFTLPYLKSIRLSFNHFSKLEEFTIISSSILESLELRSNDQSGPFPKSILQLGSLYRLDLSSNKFTGSVQLDELFGLTSLSELHLSYNNLSISWNASNYDLLSIPNINVLGLASCNFKTFPNFLINQSGLGSLDLSDNQIHGIVPNWIWKLPYLDKLNISHNFLTNFQRPMTNHIPNLILLDLHNNQLQGPIPMFHQSVIYLDYSTNNFSSIPQDIGLVVPKSLSHCSSLKVLDIGSTQILCGFPCFLKYIPTLSVLVLRNNKFHGTIECSHSQADKHWKMIQIVDISCNNFNGKLQEKYFATWDRMMQDEVDVIPDFIHTRNKDCSYYQDSVTVSIKGQQMKFVKILAIFTAIDFSSNHFEGPIPQVLMEFKAIHVLNFSNNGISGEIPSTIGNLKQLESLDLSNNSLVGVIPVQLASLSFLSYLNLSFNHLVGKIPTGTQLQSFQASSFEGNKGLYGPLLPEKLNGNRQDELPLQPACERLACSIDWNFLSVELGFVFGLGIIICPLLFWKKWRVSYWKLADKILCRIFQRMYFEYATDR